MIFIAAIIGIVNKSEVPVPGPDKKVKIYPMKKVPTVDIHGTSPAGPLAMFITADLFVSGIKPDSVTEA